MEQPPKLWPRSPNRDTGTCWDPLVHTPPGVPRGSTTELQSMERASWGGGFSNWNCMLYNSSPFNWRLDTHTHTHTHTSRALFPLLSRRCRRRPCSGSPPSRSPVCPHYSQKLTAIMFGARAVHSQNLSDSKLHLLNSSALPSHGRSVSSLFIQ